MTEDYHLVMVAYSSGEEAIVSRHSLWSDALDALHEAVCDGNDVSFVHHVHDVEPGKPGTVDDRTQEAAEATLKAFAEMGGPLTFKQREWVERKFGIEIARAFKLEDE